MKGETDLETETFGGWYDMDRAKSCAEIAEELGTSRQNTNQVLKRGMAKVYNKMLHERQITSSPTETLTELLRFFGVEHEEDTQEFFKILPETIKQEIKDDYYGSRRTEKDEV